MKYCLMLMLLLQGCAWSKQDKLLGVASCIAAAGDAYTTTMALDNPNNWEINPILGEHPSDTEVIIYMVTSQGIALLVAHIFPKLRPWILGGKTVVNLGGTINNMQLDWGKE